MFPPAPKKHSRIGQWDGRRRSSRHEEPVLPLLMQRPVQIRLGCVLLTVLALTVISFCWGPTQPFRVGQISPHDLRARVYFEITDQIETERRRDEAVEALPGDRRADAAFVEITRRAVVPVMDRYPPGTLLVPRGAPITGEQHRLLRLEQRAFSANSSLGDRLRRGGSLFLVMALLSSCAVLYVVRFQHALAASLPKIFGVCSLVVMTLVFSLVLSQADWQAVLVPLTVTSLVITIAYNPQFALLLTIALTMATTVALGGRLNDFFIASSGQTCAILLLRSVKTRTRLIEVGAMAGLAYFSMLLASEVYAEQSVRTVLFDAFRALIWGTSAGFIVCGTLPVIERLFAIVTDVRLLELGDGSHPLLQELVRRAPGTYTHSMTVATIAEPAAEAIGANPLLARVGSYFHDIGKMLKPHYFIENQAGENRHDQLEPALSTLIIIGHVKDGVALAEQYGLPRPIIDFIQQHHGTTLVEYFYREALKLHAVSGQATSQSDGSPHPLEPTFRYPGPKPQTRESAIVMLTDSVESASRAQSSPTPGSLRKLVHDMMLKRLLDGQFEESGLTLTELHTIEESLCKSLIALYHTRIKYPEAEKKAG